MPDLRSLDACLTASPTLSQVLAHARLLARAQTILQNALPSNLARACRVANMRNGVFIIHADQGAVAVKLRQLSGRLARELLSQGVDCTGIDIAVQASSIAPETPIPSARPLSEGARESLRKLAESLPQESGLHISLSRLAGSDEKSAKKS